MNYINILDIIYVNIYNQLSLFINKLLTFILIDHYLIFFLCRLLEMKLEDMKQVKISVDENLNRLNDNNLSKDGIITDLKFSLFKEAEEHKLYAMKV